MECRPREKTRFTLANHPPGRRDLGIIRYAFLLRTRYFGILRGGKFRWGFWDGVVSASVGVCVAVLWEARLLGCPRSSQFKMEREGNDLSGSPRPRKWMEKKGRHAVLWSRGVGMWFFDDSLDGILVVATGSSRLSGFRLLCGSRRNEMKESNSSSPPSRNSE